MTESVPLAVARRHDPARIARRSTVLAFGRECLYHAGHAAQVSRLAKVLYRQLVATERISTHTLRPGPVGEWLEYAALLHDIGYIVDEKKHHRHAERLIREASLPGFLAHEIEIVALTARFHRKRWPGPDHKAFTGLGRADYETVKTLSAVLRVADGLDRTHRHVVRNIVVGKTEPQLEIGIVVADVPDLEIQAATKKSDLLGELIGARVVIQPLAFDGQLLRDR